MEDASKEQYLDPDTLIEWNPHYCPTGLRLWLSASFFAGNVQEGLLKTRLREGSVICWKDADKLVETQGLNMDAHLRTLLGAEAKNLRVRFLYSLCDSSLQPVSEPLQLNAIWLVGNRCPVFGEYESASFDAGSWRPRCLVMTQIFHNLLASQMELVSGLEALCMDTVYETPGCHDAFQHLRVLHLNRMEEITVTALEFLGSMSSLERLMLSDFEDLTEFPEVIRKLSNLRQLCLMDFNYGTYYLPDWLGELGRLEKMHLACSDLVLPSSLGALPSLCRLSLTSVDDINSLELISNLQSLEKLSLRISDGGALPLAITGLTRLTKLKLLGRHKYQLPKEFSLGCFPRLKLLRLSGDMIESLDKTRLPKMEKVPDVSKWGGKDSIYEAKAPFTWPGPPQSMHSAIVNTAEPELSLDQHNPPLRRLASTDVEAAAEMEAVNEVSSDRDAGLEQSGSALPAPAHSLGTLRPQPSHCLPPLPLSSNIGRQATSEQAPEPVPEPAPNVERARKTSPGNAVPCKISKVVSAMKRFGEIPRMLEDTSKKFEPRDLERVSATVEDRYDALRGELGGLCQLLGMDITTLQRSIPDKGVPDKMRMAVSSMERLGEIPKMLKDINTSLQPRDLQRMSAKVEDRVDALCGELNGLCKLLGIETTTLFEKE